MLNIFRNGNHHNELHETKNLLLDRTLGWIIHYRWAPEIIYGSVSGQPARVWVYRDELDK